MLFFPYKHYLYFLKKKSEPSIFQKIAITFLALLFIALGASSAFLYYQYKKDAPAQVQAQYLEKATVSFKNVKESLDEVLSTFKVAGAKIQFIDSFKEASNSVSASAAGFFTSIDDIQKTLSKIELAKKNITFQKQLLKEKTPPVNYAQTNAELLSFYESSEKLLTDIYQTHNFAKEITLASGPNFYLPILTNENLWKDGASEEIKSYYQKTRTEAGSVLEKFSKISPPSDFKDYLDIQTAYLERVVKTSDNIIKTLDEKDTKDLESARQIEKAYQLLVGAKRENNELSQKVLEKRLEISSLKDNLDKFASIRIMQNSLETKLKDLENSQPQNKVFKFPVFFK